VLKDLLEAGVLEFSDSEWASPIVIVLKKDGKTIRLCVDYRRVNMLVRLLGIPLPIIDDMLLGLDKYLWFLSLDMASGFWAVPLTKRARAISAFVCPLGHFQWTRMPFGFKNAPLIYQALLNNCLWGFVRLPPHEEDEVDDEVLDYLQLTNSAEDRCQFPAKTDEHGEKLTVFQYNRPFPSHVKPILARSSYIDDVGFGAEFWSAVGTKLNELLYWLRYWNISVGLPKCEIGKYVVFLSHLISREGIQAKPKILKTLKELPFPRSLKEVQSFLGSLNYHHKFIENYPVIAASLYELTDERIKTGHELERAKKALELLKEKISTAPLLRHPRGGEPFHVIVYANQWAICATVCQFHQEKLHPVRYVGRTLHDAETRYTVAEKEVLALLRVVNTCYTFLVGQELVVHTRHSTLKWMYTGKNLSGRALQWATMLSPWTFRVEKTEKDVDGLAKLLGAAITPREYVDQLSEELRPDKALLKPTQCTVPGQIPEDYEGYLVSFDGGYSRTHKSGGAAAVLWKLPQWEVIYAGGKFVTGVTNNETEYHALLWGLQIVLKQGIDSVIVVGDSNLVIKQVTGMHQCREPHLEVLMHQASFGNSVQGN